MSDMDYYECLRVEQLLDKMEFMASILWMRAWMRRVEGYSLTLEVTWQ